jgi:hypothetical protein
MQILNKQKLLIINLPTRYKINKTLTVLQLK